MNSKKIITILLIITMITNNVGAFTLAASISNLTTDIGEKEDYNLLGEKTHKYYEHIKYEGNSYLLNDEGDGKSTDDTEETLIESGEEKTNEIGIIDLQNEKTDVYLICS